MTRQKILIDGYNLDLESGTGVATYARSLSHRVHELDFETHVLYAAAHLPKQQLLREIAFYDPYDKSSRALKNLLRRPRDVMSSPFGLKAKHIPSGNVITKTFSSRLPYFDRMWAAWRLFNRATQHFDIYRTRMSVSLGDRPDIAHWTYPLPLKIPGAKNIYTIHDLVPLLLPYTTGAKKRRYFKLVRMLCRTADHIVTVSENSRRDIVNLLGVPEERVTNTYQCVDIPEKYANKTDEEVRREVEGIFNLSYKNYVLFFGAIEPKKNVGRMIEGYLASKINTPLVMVGKAAWKAEPELRLLNDNVTRYLEQVERQIFTTHCILRIDYASFPLLVSLIKGAKAVLFPSLYEGFGLPVLEAMQLGTPVVTSTESSLPEVAGDGALLVDPYDVRQIANAIRALDENAELRDDLIAKGRKRAALFTADAYRKRLGELYRRLS